jgi:anti-sigma-K factor RskA
VNSAANESVHTLSGAYVVDALDDDERQAFEEHLPGCHDCQAEVASLREAAALMADDAALTPPPSLRASVLAGISTVRPLPPETTTESPADETHGDAVVVPLRHRRRFRLATLAAAAAVLAIVGFGAVVQPWQDQNPPIAAISPADRVLAADDATHSSINFDDGSKATVVRSLSEGRAVLVTQDMAAPPKGKTYELWLQDKTGHMAPAGLMSSPGDNKVLLRGDATKATGVGITVEPAGGSPQPTSNPVAVLELDKAAT